MSQQVVQFSGVPIKFGLNMLIVPALSLRNMREQKENIQAFIDLERKAAAGEEVDTFEALEFATKVIGAALRRNYKHIKDEELEDNIDLGNMRPFIQAVLGQSGFELTDKVPEVSQSGEAQASSQSTGG